MHFDDFTAFVAWKANEETRTHSTYVQQCAPRLFSTGKHWYYYCNRSGLYRTTTKGIRQTKSQGSSKIEERCTAHIKAIQDLSSGEVLVEYCSTHHNHEVNLGHVRLQHDTRMKIASQLQQGVAITRIVDNINTGEHLVTKQDIHIKNHYNIEGVIRHANDQTSWVEELMSLPYDPILLFKPQGKPQTDGMDNIANDDFILAIQTEFQGDMLVKYGGTCVDSTHGTNMYDFHLITLLVIDAFGEGLPVAWCVSNREDTTMLVEFLKAIREGH